MLKPIYENGSLPEKLCIDHQFVKMRDKAEHIVWQQCKFCGKQIDHLHTQKFFDQL